MFWYHLRNKARIYYARPDVLKHACRFIDFFFFCHLNKDRGETCRLERVQRGIVSLERIQQKNMKSRQNEKGAIKYLKDPLPYLTHRPPGTEIPSNSHDRKSRFWLCTIQDRCASSLQTILLGCLSHLSFCPSCTCWSRQKLPQISAKSKRRVAAKRPSHHRFKGC